MEDLSVKTQRFLTLTSTLERPFYLNQVIPLWIASTGETISVGVGSSTVNFFITGDQESLINGPN